jgi:hypothetical protein
MNTPVKIRKAKESFVATFFKDRPDATGGQVQDALVRKFDHGMSTTKISSIRRKIRGKALAQQKRVTRAQLPVAIAISSAEDVKIVTRVLDRIQDLVKLRVDHVGTDYVVVVKS